MSHRGGNNRIDVTLLRFLSTLGDAGVTEVRFRRTKAPRQAAGEHWSPPEEVRE
jgi:hypothetical protein